MTVTYEVPPDNVRHGRIVVNDDDPTWWIGVTYQGFPFQRSAKNNGYASKVRRQQPPEPVNRAKASPVRKHSDDSVSSGPIGADPAPRQITWVNTEDVFAPP
jgi:hypothetical protein